MRIFYFLFFLFSDFLFGFYFDIFGVLANKFGVSHCFQISNSKFLFYSKFDLFLLSRSKLSGFIFLQNPCDVLAVLIWRSSLLYYLLFASLVQIILLFVLEFFLTKLSCKSKFYGSSFLKEEIFRDVFGVGVSLTESWLKKYFWANFQCKILYFASRIGISS